METPYKALNSTAEPSFVRVVLIAAIVIGISHITTWSSDIGDGARLSWKFACVGTLALYAGLCARTFDGWLITAVMLLSAFSDVFLETIGQIPGAISFIVADIMAIILYSRNLRPGLTSLRYLLGGMYVLAAVALAYVLPANRDEALGIALFTIPLASMSAIAFMTRFPSQFVGLGAAMVLASDLLIFARMGPLHNTQFTAETVWLLYFIGEVLIVVGVTRALKANLIQTNS
jgi:uncharacterized membrane protein YhhN